jgi:glycerol-3-phosphate acyltransferase PlsY
MTLGAARITVAAAAFLLGSIPVGPLLLRRARGGDLQSVGSKSTGASNVFREGGAALGAATLVLDAAKGAAAVLLARLAQPGDQALAEWAAVFAALGHVFPPWLRFRGGKGAATAAGGFAVLHPLAVLFAAALFAVVTVGTRHASLGSIAAALFYALGIGVARTGSASLLAALAATALIVFRHKENLERLLRGEEPPLVPKDRAR